MTDKAGRWLAGGAFIVIAALAAAHWWGALNRHLAAERILAYERSGNPARLEEAAAQLARTTALWGDAYTANLEGRMLLAQSHALGDDSLVNAAHERFDLGAQRSPLDPTFTAWAAVGSARTGAPRPQVAEQVRAALQLAPYNPDVFAILAPHVGVLHFAVDEDIAQRLMRQADISAAHEPAWTVEKLFLFGLSNRWCDDPKRQKYFERQCRNVGWQPLIEEV